MKNYSKNATHLITVLLFSFVVILLIIPSKCEAVSNDMQPLEARSADLIQEPRYIINVPPRCPPGSKFVKNRCRVIVP